MNWQKGAVVVLLVIFLFTTISSITNKSITNDELAHIPSGYSYWKTADFRLNPEHPPLMKLLAGIPLLILSPELPLLDPSWKEPHEWQFGARFFYTFNNNADQIVFWARIPIILTAVLLGIYVFRWARELFGDLAGLMALLLYVFSPNILAQARFVTTDLGIAAFSFIATYYYWKFCHHQTRRNLLLAGVFFGLALSAKFTGVYMVPLFLLLGAGWVWLTHWGQPFDRLVKTELAKQLMLWTSVIFGIGGLVLVGTYFVVGFPQYIVGLIKVTLHSAYGHQSYLMGQFSEDGWWYYFFVAYLIKTPVALTLLAILAGICCKRTKPSKEDLFLLLPIVLFFASFVFNKINIGVRHILPIYPFLFVFVSRLALLKQKLLRSVIIVCIFSFMLSSMLIYPHYLAYFNILVGGPENGYRYLSDSNIDWGQDLKGLKVWMDAHGAENITLSYFGKDSREYRNITWDELKCGPQAGLIALGAARLVGFNAEDAKCTGWLLEHEPLDSVGHSILIYNITQDSIKEQEQEYCALKCNDKCVSQNQVYEHSVFNGTCKCICSL